MISAEKKALKQINRNTQVDEDMKQLLRSQARAKLDKVKDMKCGAEDTFDVVSNPEDGSSENDDKSKSGNSKNEENEDGEEGDQNSGEDDSHSPKGKLDKFSGMKYNREYIKKLYDIV